MRLSQRKYSFMFIRTAYCPSRLKTFAERYVHYIMVAKSTKVFSLKTLPLYSINYMGLCVCVCTCVCMCVNVSAIPSGLCRIKVHYGSI